MSGYAPFHAYCPEIGYDEYRSVILFPGAGKPVREFGFMELYCTEPDCDCRRVIFRVVTMERPGEIVATIAYGWESPEYYVKWMYGDKVAERMAGLTTEMLWPQSDLTGMLFEMCRDHLISDRKYVERLKRHYALFRKALAAKLAKGKGAPTPPRPPKRKRPRWKH